MTRVLITGGSGFVGRHLIRELRVLGFDVAVAVRDRSRLEDADAIDVRLEAEIDGDTNWERALGGVDAVVHLAARVHVMDDDAADPLRAFRRVNVDGTRRLAEACAAAGVKRLVFVSSVKAAGEEASRPLSEGQAPAPQDPYGISKWEAEQALAEIAGRTGLETVVLRPPLVYGPGVGANFRNLLRICDTAVPLPLGAATENARSVIYVANLTGAIIAALRHPDAPGGTFFVRDETEPSVADLAARIRRALGRRACLVPVPVGAMRLGLRMAGRGAAADRLFGSLRVDDGHIRKVLNWTPPFTLDQGLAATAAWYKTSNRGSPTPAKD